MRQLIFLFFVLSFFLSCDKSKESEKLKEGEYLLKGKLINTADKNIYLESLRGNTWVILDSSEVSSDGSFLFTGKIDEPDFFILRVAKEQPLIVFLEKNIETELNVDVQHPIESIKIGGAKANTEYYDFRKKLNSLDSMGKSYQAKITNQSLPQDSLEGIQNLLANLDDQRESFVKNYIDSILPSMAVFNMLNYINPDNNLDYLKGLSERLKEKMANDKYTKIYTDEIVIHGSK